jgi:CMP-N-acetylneuraminic acid synthetase
MPPTVLGVIPARGGSKSIPRKNLVPLAGKPLIAYTIEAAKRSARLDRWIVSTDSEEIATVSRAVGAQVPFLRPAELAADTVLSLPVMQHALRALERMDGRPYDIAVMLQPTCPFRSAADIDAAIDLLISTLADAVISVVEVGGHHPLRMKRIVDGNRLVNYVDQDEENMRPRQQLPPVYIRNGALYLTKRSVLLEDNSFTGRDCRAYVMPVERSVNIDEVHDVFLAESILRHHAAAGATAGMVTS